MKKNNYLLFDDGVSGAFIIVGRVSHRLGHNGVAHYCVKKRNTCRIHLFLFTNVSPFRITSAFQSRT